jgi:hypothetical protein
LRGSAIGPLRFHHLLEQLEFARTQINRAGATLRSAVDEIESSDPTRSTVTCGSTDGRAEGSISIDHRQRLFRGAADLPEHFATSLTIFSTAIDSSECMSASSMR